MLIEEFHLRVEEVLGVDLALDPREARSMLELAYVAIASDHVLAAAEVEAFQHVASVLRDKAVFSRRGRRDTDPPRSLDLGEPETFELLGNVARDTGKAHEVIHRAAERLARVEVREAAYKLAFAMTLADFETSHEEMELDDHLAAELGIDDARAEALEAEVYAALEGH